MNRAALPVFLALALLSLSRAALASDPFPDTIKAQLMLTDAPLVTCTLCHQTLIGGLMTVTKPFGRNLQQKYGLQMKDVAGLQKAITQAQVNGDDVDGDGVGDIAELLQGTDPNVPGEGGTLVDEGARYGCYCSAKRPPPSAAFAGAAWLSGLTFSRIRRRAARRVRIEKKA
jgi:hypothetical protein